MENKCQTIIQEQWKDDAIKHLLAKVGNGALFTDVEPLIRDIINSPN